MYFSSLSFRLCYRDCNRVVHRLARWAVSRACDEVSVDVAPAWLEDALYSDLIQSEY